MSSRYMFTCAICHIKYATKQGMKIVDHKLTCRACRGNQEVKSVARNMSSFEKHMARKQARIEELRG